MLSKDNGRNGTLRHRLVSYITNYSKTYFLGYVNEVINEMDGRNIKYQNKYHEEIENFCIWGKFPIMNYPEHNNRYLKQCVYNLEEKYDRGIISEEEWKKIYDKYLTND